MTDQQMLSEARDWLVSIMNITPTEESAEHHAKRSNQLKWLIDKVEQQQQEIERLREALGFYADEINNSLGANFPKVVSKVGEDNGDIARQVLKGESK